MEAGVPKTPELCCEMKDWIPRLVVPTVIGKPKTARLSFFHQETGSIGNGTYLILSPPEAFLVASSDLVHRIRIAQVRRRLVIAPRSHGILLHSPPMPERIRELVHGQYELAFGCTAFLHAGVERLGFYRC